MEVASGSRGQLVWEVVDLSTGQARKGQRELQLTDFEVIVLPPPARPHLHQALMGPRRLVTNTLGWLIKGGRGSSTKRVRLADGFWLVLRERRSPARPPLVFLTVKRDQTRLSGAEWFRVNEDGVTATQAEGTGSLGLKWEQDQNGFQELVSFTAATDVSLRLQPARGPVGRDPIWEVRILAGSTIHWPRAADGVRLVPRLRPDDKPPTGSGDGVRPRH